MLNLWGGGFCGMSLARRPGVQEHWGESSGTGHLRQGAASFLPRHTLFHPHSGSSESMCVWGGGTQCPGLAQLAWAHGGFPGAQAKLHFTSFSGAGATVGFVGVRRGHSENQA